METNIVYVRNSINNFYDSIKNSNKHTIQHQKYIKIPGKDIWHVILMI